MRLNRIYTRTGDDGTTGLVDGSRAPKDSLRLAAIGDVDEANSAIGIAVTALDGVDEVTALLRRVQNDLFDLGADIATPGEDFTPSEMTLRIVAGQVTHLEDAIDRFNADLEPLRSFILPGGTVAAAHVHLARAIARRAERALVAAHREVSVNPQAIAYLNRLSDLLFVLARWLNRTDGDILWVPGGGR